MTTGPTDWEPARKRFSVSEYHRLAQLGFIGPDERTELIEGEIIPMAPIGPEHASHTRHLVQLLSSVLGESAIVDAQNPVQLGEESEPQPDVSVLRPREDYYADAHPTPDDVLLLVEISDTSLAFDRQTKVPMYARHGIAVVWLVDLQNRAVEVYEQPLEGVYERVHVLRGAASVEHDALGLEFEARDLFIK